MVNNLPYWMEDIWRGWTDLGNDGEWVPFHKRWSSLQKDSQGWLCWGQWVIKREGFSCKGILLNVLSLYCNFFLDLMTERFWLRWSEMCGSQAERFWQKWRKCELEMCVRNERFFLIFTQWIRLQEYWKDERGLECSYAFDQLFHKVSPKI